MIKERYVSPEVARLLRDKGFDEDCIKTYNISSGQRYTGSETCNSEFTDIGDMVTAPTQSMACDWIEENYKIHIVVRFVSKLGYVASICDISNPDSTLYMLNTRAFPNTESVYNEALEYVLTNLV